MLTAYSFLQIAGMNFSHLDFSHKGPVPLTAQVVGHESPITGDSKAPSATPQTRQMLNHHF